MKLNIICSTENLNECIELAEIYLKCKLKIQKEKMSIFEQYRVYPNEKKFISKLWSYRIVVNKGIYNFGTLHELI